MVVATGRSAAARRTRWSVLMGVCAIAACPAPAGPGEVSDAEVLAITAKHCTTCHARMPTHESFPQPAKDVTLETVEDLKRYAPLILEQTVFNKAMPLGNQTGMTDAERERLGRWLAALR